MGATLASRNYGKFGKIGNTFAPATAEVETLVMETLSAAARGTLQASAIDESPILANDFLERACMTASDDSHTEIVRNGR
jgi:hypothetical protein